MPRIGICKRLDSPQSTLLVVLQVVSAILALLVFVGARQARHRDGVWLWAIAFAIHAISQLLREIAELHWGHQASLPIGHLGGPLAYGLLYIGVRRYLGLVAENMLVLAALLIATGLSFAAISHGSSFISLALTACFTALFQALTTAAFWGAWQRDGGVIRAGAAATFAVSAAADLSRALWIVPAWHIASTLIPANDFWLLIFIALNILQAGCLLFLLNQTLLDELQSMVDYDTLTGLLNRRGLSHLLQRRIRRRKEAGSATLGCLCMDLDHFKSINDTHGHGAGDDVLKGVGKLIQDNSRPGDIPSRQGGEEFGVILEAASENELMALAERMRAAVANAPFPTRAGPISITISIGAALARNAGESLEDLAERADHSLLAAKRGGRNRVVLAAALRCNSRII